MHLYFTRHGQPQPQPRSLGEGESADHLKGDPVLSPLGREQAQRLGDRLAQAGFEGAIYASPYRRTMETAQLVAERVDGRIVPCPPIREEVMRPGQMEGFRGLTLVALRRAFPRIADDAALDHPWWSGQVESRCDIEARVVGFVDRLIQRAGAQDGATSDALLVSHAGVAGAPPRGLLERMAPGYPLDELPPTFNCALSVLRAGSESKVIAVNCVRHLPAESVTANARTREEVLERRRSREAERA